MWDVFGSLKEKRKYAPIVCFGLKQHRRATANRKPVVNHPNTFNKYAKRISRLNHCQSGDFIFN